MTTKKILALTCIIIALLMVKMTAQHLQIKKLETQIADIELQCQVKSFIDELRIPSEALYYDHDAMKQIYTLRQQAYEKMQIKEFLPYRNVFVKPVGHLFELSRLSNVLSKGANAWYGSPDNPKGSIYCPVAEGGSWTWIANASYENFWLNQINHSIGSFKFDLEQNYRLGKYYNEHPNEFDKVVKPWVLRITRSTNPDTSLKACEILLKRGHRDEEITEAVRQVIERSPSKRHVSSSKIKQAERLSAMYKLGE